MKFTHRTIMAIAAFVLLAFAAGALVWRRQTALFSDPDQPRANPQYERVILGLAAAPPPVPEAPFEQIITERDESRLRFEFKHPEATRDEDLIQFERIEGRLTDWTTVGDGAIRLGYIGIGYGVPQTNFQYDFEVPGKFFGPDLQPLPAETASSLAQRWSTGIQYRGEYPIVEFGFLKTNLLDFMPLTFHAFDARTRQTLGSGMSSSFGKDWFTRTLAVQLWHQTPVDLTVSFATGPVEVKSLPPEEGAQARLGNRVVQLIALLKGNPSSWSSAHGSGTNTVTIQLAEKDRAESTLTLVLLEWPKAHPSPIDIGVYDNAGERMASRGGSTTDNIRVMTLKGTVDEISELRLSYHTRSHQVMFRLPEIPGLPEQNRGLENLFETHIPYMRLRYEHDLQRAVQALTAMQMQHLALSYPQGYFPLAFTNATPADLFREVEQWIPQDRRLVVDSEKNEIRVQPPVIQDLKERFQTLLQPR